LLFYVRILESYRKCFSSWFLSHAVSTGSRQVIATLKPIVVRTVQILQLHSVCHDTRVSSLQRETICAQCKLCDCLNKLRAQQIMQYFKQIVQWKLHDILTKMGERGKQTNEGLLFAPFFSTHFPFHLFVRPVVSSFHFSIFLSYLYLFTSVIPVYFTFLSADRIM
jgi:hypothetical protein